MKPLFHVALRALPAVLLFGCSAGAPDKTISPVPHGVEAEPASVEESLNAGDLAELGKNEFRELNLEAAEMLFTRALQLEPGNAEIGKWRDRTRSLISEHTAGFEHGTMECSGGLQSGRGAVADLIECRLELDRHMRDFTNLLRAGDSAGAAQALDNAVRHAQQIPRLAHDATDGRAQSCWLALGTRELTDGNCSSAALCMEIASLDSSRWPESATRLRAEVNRRQAERLQRFAVPPSPNIRTGLRASRLVRGPAPLQAAANRDMCSQLLQVARSRLFTMDREALSSDLDLIASLGGENEETSRMREALPHLEGFTPFSAETGTPAYRLADCAVIIRLEGEAERFESRGDWHDAALAHERVAATLSFMPFRPGIDALSRSANSSASNCRHWDWNVDSDAPPPGSGADPAVIHDW